MKISGPNGENKNIIYINERLKDKIDKIPLYDITVIDAPAGYGKTEAVSVFSKECKGEVKTISVLSSSSEIFFMIYVMHWVFMIPVHLCYLKVSAFQKMTLILQKQGR